MSACTLFTNMYRQLSFFYNDYESARSSASEFDERVKTAAGGQDYLSLTSLAARQAFAAIEYTNTPAEPWLFMKEISSDGNVNTADGKSINSDAHGHRPSVKLTKCSHISFPSGRYLHERYFAQVSA
jgi:hypothetical protein